jgi:ATP-dependent DNA helicase Q1
VIALTATATTKGRYLLNKSINFFLTVATDVKGILQIQNCEFFQSSFNRPNLYYEVRHKSSSAKDGIFSLFFLIHFSVLEDIVKFIKSKFPTDCGIVYCFSRKEAENVTSELKARGLKAECYHGSVDADKKEEGIFFPPKILMMSW